MPLNLRKTIKKILPHKWTNAFSADNARSHTTAPRDVTTNPDTTDSRIHPPKKLHSGEGGEKKKKNRNYHRYAFTLSSLSKRKIQMLLQPPFPPSLQAHRALLTLHTLLHSNHHPTHCPNEFRHKPTFPFRELAPHSIPTTPTG